MNMRDIAVLVAATGIVLAGPATADEYTVTQKNKEFNQTEMTLSAGDTVRFVNQDDRPHNVYSRSSANRFDLGIQNPGDGDAVAFSTPGTVNVRCAIHPKMKLTVTVKP